MKRRLSRWVYDGLGTLARGSEASWKLSLHLDERTVAGETGLVLELWLQAEDDPTLSLPAALVWEGGEEVFPFLRASDARKDFVRQLAELEPLLAEHGIRFEGPESTEVPLDVDEAGVFLRESIPQLEARGVPVLLPSAWVTLLMLRAASSLRMVPAPWPSASCALTGLDRLTRNVSSGSGVVSPFTATVIVLLKSPGLKVRSPLVAW